MQFIASMIRLRISQCSVLFCNTISLQKEMEANMEMTNPTPPAQRTQLKLNVSFKKIYSRSDTNGTVKNISLTGAFLEHQGERFKANEKLHLKLNVGDRARKIACKVVWVNSFGCGIKFLPMNNRDVQIVDDLIYFVQNHRAERQDLLDDIFKKVAS